MKLTILKPFGIQSIFAFNYSMDFGKIKRFLIENGLCGRTIRLVFKRIKQEKGSITIRKKHSRSKNGDLITYMGESGAKNLNQSINVVSKPKKVIESFDGEILKCQFIRLRYINTGKLKGILIRLENGAIKELFCNQRMIDQLPIFQAGSRSTPELIIYYYDEFNWAIN